jgi:hypothetical protein
MSPRWNWSRVAASNPCILYSTLSVDRTAIRHCLSRVQNDFVMARTSVLMKSVARSFPFVLDLVLTRLPMYSSAIYARDEQKRSDGPMQASYSCIIDRDLNKYSYNFSWPLLSLELGWEGDHHVDCIEGKSFYLFQRGLHDLYCNIVRCSRTHDFIAQYSRNFTPKLLDNCHTN